MSGKLFDPVYVNGLMSQIETLKDFFPSASISEGDVYKELKMSRQTWKRRLVNKDFTVKEMAHIVRIINKKMGWNKRP